MNAERLLVEQGSKKAVEPLEKIVSGNKPSYAKVHALYTLARLDTLKPALLNAAAVDSAPAVRKTAFAVASNEVIPGKDSIIKALEDSDPRVRLTAALAAGKSAYGSEASGSLTPVQTALAKAFENSADPWIRSAIVSVVAQRPSAWASLVTVPTADPRASLAVEFCNLIANKQDADLAARVVQSLQSSGNDALKQAVLEALGKGLRPDTAPTWNDELRAALSALLHTDNSGVRAAVLPLLTRWDKQGTLRTDAAALVKQLAARLQEASTTEDEKLQLATSLIGAREIYPQIVETVGGLLGQGGSTGFRRKLIDALGTVNEPTVGGLFVNAFGSLPAELQSPAFAQLIKRSDWSLALIEG